jgi:hypothetical protein
MLDYQNPQQSRLLLAASRPHGTAASAIFDPQTVKYRQLAGWIALVTQKVPGAPDPIDQPATVGIGGQSTRNLNQSSDALATGDSDGDASPVKPLHRNRIARAIVSRSDSGSAGKDRSALLPNPPQIGPNSTAPATNGADPFDPETFNRQFAEPPAGEQTSK